MVEIARQALQRAGPWRPRDGIPLRHCPASRSAYGGWKLLACGLGGEGALDESAEGCALRLGQECHVDGVDGDLVQIVAAEAKLIHQEPVFALDVGKERQR